MIDNSLQFHELLNLKSLKILHPLLNKVIQNYSFFHISNPNFYDQNPQILENLQNSNVVIINKYTEENQNHDEIYFIISFKNTVLLINQISLKIFQNFFDSISDLSLCFLTDLKGIFDQIIHVQYHQIECSSQFLKEISNFEEQFHLSKEPDQSIYCIWQNIRKSIVGYLIKQSYIKINSKNSIEMKIKQEKQFDKYSFILLRNIGTGSGAKVDLAYYIEKEELFVTKQYIIDYSEEYKKLFEREINNYKSIFYPRLPKFYGTIKNKNCLVIEFIDGITLLDMDKHHFNFNQKNTIILQLIMIINYLHKNGFIYRDLKPNNVIIDQNTKVFLVDFDRMVKYSNIINCTSFTSDLVSLFVDPEAILGKISFENDIYSLGKMIYYIGGLKSS